MVRGKLQPDAHARPAPRYVFVPFEGRHVLGVMPAPGSPSALAGADVVFILCSEACRTLLQDAARREGVLRVIH